MRVLQWKRGDPLRVGSLTGALVGVNPAGCRDAASVQWSAMARNDVAPAACSSAITGSGSSLHMLGSEADTTVAAQLPPKG